MTIKLLDRSIQGLALLLQGHSHIRRRLQDSSLHTLVQPHLKPTSCASSPAEKATKVSHLCADFSLYDDSGNVRTQQRRPLDEDLSRAPTLSHKL